MLNYMEPTIDSNKNFMHFAKCYVRDHPLYLILHLQINACLLGLQQIKNSATKDILEFWNFEIINKKYNNLCQNISKVHFHKRK